MKTSIEKMCRPVKSNLLLQNCFLRDVSMAKDLSSSYPEKTYPELQREQLSNGFVEHVQNVPYPVTPKSVNSYAESCDYKRDPVGAVLRGSHSQNLGDVTEFQNIMSMDSSQVRSVYERLKTVFEKPVEKSVEKPVEKFVEK